MAHKTQDLRSSVYGKSVCLCVCGDAKSKRTEELANDPIILNAMQCDLYIDTFFI